MFINNASDNMTSSSENHWLLIEEYFKNRPLQQLVKHQLESYNDLIETQLPRTISMFNPVRIKSEHDFVPGPNKYRLEIFVTFDKFRVQRPQIHENNGATKLMFPNEARARNFTYASPMTVTMNIKYIIRTGDQLESEQTLYKQLPDINIGRIPIMLRSRICILEQYSHLSNAASGECSMDPGGYFIVSGSEKTCLGQERAAENQVQCFSTSKTSSRYSWTAEVKSVPDNKCISPKQVIMYLSAKDNGFGQSLLIQIPRIKQPIPLFILFRALGIQSDKDICEYIILNSADPTDESASDLSRLMLMRLSACIVDANTCMSQENAIEYITNMVLFTPLHVDSEQGAKKKMEFANDVLENDLFPHCSTKSRKIRFLGYMANRLLKCAMGVSPQDDRDSYLNKRIDLTGSLLNNLFRNYFNKLVKDMQKQICREINNGSWRANEDYLSIINMTNIYKIIKASTVENGLKRALATGDFGIKQTNSNKVGVAQVLNRLTYISSLSHLRRVNTPIDKSGKLIPPRKLHSTSWGMLCPAETPEGGSVGVVKNLSYMTHVTIPSNSNALYDFILPQVDEFDNITHKECQTRVKVFINGAWVGLAKDPIELFNDLKHKKSMGVLNIYVSIVFNPADLEIKICNDAGRLMRPLLRVKNNRLVITQEHFDGISSGKLTWEDMLINIKVETTAIEYIDSAEQNNSLIAMNPNDLDDSNRKLGEIKRYTHCELHPSTIFGILASCIPFPEHNQAPRNTYQCAMGKQAMGMYVTNFDTRMDKTAYVLSYPMRPLVDTRLMNMINLNNIPSGQPVIVAIMSHTGYNQEDSILFNKGSIDRGLFQATIYHTEKDEDKKLHGDTEIRCKPDPSKTKGMKFGNYDKIDRSGTIPENSLVENRDIIMAKVVPIREARNDPTKILKYEDSSRLFRTHEEAYIDKNRIERNGDGYTCCKVKVRTVRKPVIGDKFSSRHGQKGTIGNIIPERDMPYTAEGIRPDIIINPHAIPSRMTIAQLKETLLGKVLLELGMFGDGTSFGTLEMKSISKELTKLGYESHGNELLYNGMTGEQLETSIFIGPAFYQRLKHMVADKQHSRSIGPMVNLTRQPAEGRSRDGGLRYGEMERDCMCSHGASLFNKGRLYDASDSFTVHICKDCGLIAAYNDKSHIHHCKVCDNRANFSTVNIPYACKLLFQELMTMNVAPRIMT